MLVGTLVVSTVLTGYSVLGASLTKALDQRYPISAQAKVQLVRPVRAASTVTKAENCLQVKGIKNVQTSAVGLRSR